MTKPGQGTIWRVLDVGCGTGEHALMAAALGLEATGIDVARGRPSTSPAPRPAGCGFGRRFLVGNALELAALGEHFDTVLDCGLFHIFEDVDRRPYTDSLRAVLLLGGRYFMLCFSDRQPGDLGPRRVTQTEIRACFDEGWHVDSIEPAILEVIFGMGVQAWLAAITRT